LLHPTSILKSANDVPHHKKFCGTSWGKQMQIQAEWSAAEVATKLAVGRTGARIAGLQGEDIEDSAAAFVAHLWEKRGQLAQATIPAEKEGAFLKRCAYRFAISWARRERRNPVLTTDDMTLLDTVQVNPCEQSTLQAELYRVVGERVACLAPHQQALFIRCYLHGEEREQVAQETGDSTNAVKKAAQRARARLRSLLKQAGWSEPALREYLRVP
jgi:RNA polymerase sigma factor (sigma-70 family)